MAWMNQKNFKVFVQCFLALVIALSFLFAFCSRVPFNADEFTTYKVVSCLSYPNKNLENFYDVCKRLELAVIPSWYLPLRSFSYAGSLPGFIYLPFFKLWPSPYSARLLSLGMLAIQAFLLFKLFRVNFLANYLFLLLFMPYAFQNVADTGPVSMHMASIYLIVYLTYRWLQGLENKERSVGRYPAMIGILIFLGIWIKLSYFFILPGLGFLLVCMVSEQWLKWNSEQKTAFWRGTLVMALITVTLSGLLLYSQDHAGGHYYQVLQTHPLSRPWGINDIVKHFFRGLAHYIFDPITAVHYLYYNIIPRPFSWEGIVFIGLTFTFLIGGWSWVYRQKGRPIFAMAAFGSFLVTFLCLSLSIRTWAMHHVVLSYPFLILAVFSTYSRLPKKPIVALFLVVFVVTNIHLYFHLSHLKPPPWRTHPQLWSFNQLLNQRFGNRVVFVVLDWWMYNIKALYGEKDQCVIGIFRFKTEEQIASLKRDLKRVGKTPVFIIRANNRKMWILMHQAAHGLQKVPVEIKVAPWQVWKAQ